MSSVDVVILRAVEAALQELRAEAARMAREGDGLDREARGIRYAIGYVADAARAAKGRLGGFAASVTKHERTPEEKKRAAAYNDIKSLTTALANSEAAGNDEEVERLSALLESRRADLEALSV